MISLPLQSRGLPMRRTVRMLDTSLPLQSRGRFLFFSAQDSRASFECSVIIEDKDLCCGGTFCGLL